MRGERPPELLGEVTLVTLVTLAPLCRGLSLLLSFFLYMYVTLHIGRSVTSVTGVTPAIFLLDANFLGYITISQCEAQLGSDASRDPDPASRGRAGERRVSHE